MRILFCNKYNFPFSGTESYLFDLMDLLRAHGHEVALFSMADPRGNPTPYDRHFVPLTDFKKGGQGILRQGKLALQAIYSRDARSRIRKMIAEFQPDMAHVRNIYHHISPSILWELKAQSIPTIYHLNDLKMLCPNYNMVSNGNVCERCAGGAFRHVISEGCYSGGRTQAIVLAAEAYTHKWLQTYETCVNCFLAPSGFVKKKLVENGWAAEKIRVLPHFQRLSNIAPSVPSPGSPILYFGRLSPEKGLLDLLRAMERLPHLKLQIAGDGPQKEGLEKFAGEHRLTNVSFAGHVRGEALEQLISGSCFTVFPSHAYETLGKSILESHAAARAVIASDLGSRREFVKDGQTGLLFVPGNVDELATAISYLAERPKLAAQMGSAAREVIRQNHAPEDHYAELLKIYQSLSRCSQPAESSGAGAQARKLKIVFIGGRGVASKYSGIETYYEEVGKRLVAQGHEVTAYCRTYFTPQQKYYAGIRLVRLPTIRSKHLETLVHTTLSTVHAIFGGYDIVHYHALGPALFSFLPRLAGKKTTVTVQGLDWQRKKWGWAASFVLRLGEHASANFPDVTMVVSQNLQTHYRDEFSAETVYVPNGTALRKRSAVSGLSRWGLFPQQYILYMGRFSPEKNCHLLIEAHKKLRSSVKLVLAGGSSYSDSYVADLRRQQSDKIMFIDWVSGERFDTLLSNAMLFVLPSDLEGLSLALLEAMGAGVCVLASDIPENRELIQDAGFTFQPGNVEDMARVMQMLIENPLLRRGIGQLARQKIANSYEWGNVTRQVEQVYHRIMKPDLKPNPVLGELSQQNQGVVGPRNVPHG